ncbi:MAG: hypothetical protein ACRC4J_00085 [Cetobacterium sp.]
MNTTERVELLTNAMLCEISRSIIYGNGEKSVEAIIEMSIIETPKTIKQVCVEKLQERAANKNILGVVREVLYFYMVAKSLKKPLIQINKWATSMAGDLIDKATESDIQRYALLDIRYSSAMGIILQSLLLEKGY